MTDMEQGIAAWTLAQTIRDVSENRQVKAIVLRMNSPGGSAEAADYIAEAVKAAKERVPVVVSMGSVAASGGYWASMTASHIVASPVTMTGSIGVIGSWFYDNGLNSKLGLTVDVMQRGAHADLGTGMILPTRNLTQAEEARYRKYMMDLYADFTARVAENRGMDIKRVEALAQGRVYSGQGALNAGLIDSIGGLDDALLVARELAGISENRVASYIEFPKPKFFDRMLDYFIVKKVFSGRNSAPAGMTGSPATASGAGQAALFAADMILPAPLLDDLRYRIARNGQVMPILPLDSGWQR
jgi:protease-4